MDEFRSSSVSEDIENKEGRPSSSSARIGIYDRPERQGVSLPLIFGLIAILLAVIFIALVIFISMF